MQADETVVSFDCGDDDLNEFIVKEARSTAKLCWP